MQSFSPLGLQKCPLTASPYFKSEDNISSVSPSGPTDFEFLSGDDFLLLNGQQFELLQ